MRAIRGAVCLTKDDSAEMLEAVGEMLTAILERNQITTENVVSVLFTCTPDIHSGFPAKAAREFGFGDVPLIGPVAEVWSRAVRKIPTMSSI